MTIIDFESAKRGALVPRPLKDRADRSRGNMWTYAFRSYSSIVESDPATLVRDVRVDTPKAETKLRKIREARAQLEERTAAQIKLMTEAEHKLAAAIDAAPGDIIEIEPQAKRPLADECDAAQAHAEQDTLEFYHSLSRLDAKFLPVLMAVTRAMLAIEQQSTGGKS